MAHERTAKNLDINLIHIPLFMGNNKKKWKSPITGKFVRVENAVLDYYKIRGWNGYAGEGGLILNLIKAMSFPKVSNRNRATYIEALYAQNVSFEQDRFQIEWLLSNVKQATLRQIKSNFKIMASRKFYTIDFGGFTGTQNTSMLDFFPNLELDLFIELFNSLGNQKIFEIAKIFSKNPYEYRKGWPDLTVWKGGEVKFLEVKAPGDRLHKNQKAIINSFIKPLELDFSLVDVFVEN
ncbi:VRR-NUC domain-containing protein [Neptuniibacter pectenicola]|uniref:VRR-NUC domain-containing protein n=1 Tax=Neptuniibacter pectenicola TaxID=1806669 RepID=UPI003F4B87D7